MLLYDRVRKGGKSMPNRECRRTIFENMFSRFCLLRAQTTTTGYRHTSTVKKVICFPFVVPTKPKERDNFIRNF